MIEIVGQVKLEDVVALLDGADRILRDQGYNAWNYTATVSDLPGVCPVGAVAVAEGVDLDTDSRSIGEIVAGFSNAAKAALNALDQAVIDRYGRYVHRDNTFRIEGFALAGATAEEVLSMFTDAIIATTTEMAS